jgi:hypothetical protein
MKGSWFHISDTNIWISGIISLGETQLKNNDSIVRLSGFTSKKNIEIDILKSSTM